MPIAITTSVSDSGGNLGQDRGGRGATTGIINCSSETGRGSSPSPNTSPLYLDTTEQDAGPAGPPRYPLETGNGPVAEPRPHGSSPIPLEEAYQPQPHPAAAVLPRQGRSPPRSISPMPGGCVCKLCTEMEEYGEGAVGSGGQAEVRIYRYINSPAGKQDIRAVKIFTNQDKVEECYNDALKVKRAMGCKGHPNILEYLDIFICTRNGQKRVCVLMPFCEKGDLWVKSKKERGLPESEVWEVLQQVGRGLEHMHQMDLVHADIKPENILIADTDGAPTEDPPSGECVYKLADFDVSGDMEGGTHCTLRGMTRLFASPSMLTGRKANHKDDIWCLGATALVLLRGKSRSDPFAYELQEDSLHFRERMEAWVGEGGAEVSQGMMDIIFRMLQQKREDRPSATEFLTLLGCSPNPVAFPPALAPPHPPATPRPSVQPGAHLAAAAALCLPVLLLQWGSMGPQQVALLSLALLVALGGALLAMGVLHEGHLYWLRSLVSPPKLVLEGGRYVIKGVGLPRKGENELAERLVNDVAVGVFPLLDSEWGAIEDIFSYSASAAHSLRDYMQPYIVTDERTGRHVRSQYIDYKQYKRPAATQDTRIEDYAWSMQMALYMVQRNFFKALPQEVATKAMEDLGAPGRLNFHAYNAVTHVPENVRSDLREARRQMTPGQIAECKACIRTNLNYHLDAYAEAVGKGKSFGEWARVHLAE